MEEVKTLVNEIVNETTKKVVENFTPVIEELKKNYQGIVNVISKIEKNKEQETTLLDNVKSFIYENADKIRNIKNNKVSGEFKFLRSNVENVNNFGTKIDKPLLLNEQLFLQNYFRTVVLGPNSGGAVIYPVYTNGLGPIGGQVSEGQTKPQIATNIEIVSKVLNTIAVLEKFSEQVLYDFELLAQEVTNIVGYELQKTINSVILNELLSNTRNVINDISEFAPVQNPNIFDVFITLSGIIQGKSGLRPNIVILHTKDYYKLKLTKDQTGNYLFDDFERYGVTILSTSEMSDGVMLVGNTEAGVIYTDGNLRTEFDRMGDDFSKNLITLRVEQRVLFALPKYDGISWAKVNINDAINALS